jgi:predicted nucleic acid-binding protein
MMYLIDTDILIDFFRRRPAAGEYLDSKGDWSYSVVTAMELFAGANDKKQIVGMEKFLNAYNMQHLSSNIGTRALDIIKTHSKADGLDPIDAILAATALAGDMTLSTRNGKHFRNIKDLQLEIVSYPKESDAHT